MGYITLVKSLTPATICKQYFKQDGNIIKTPVADVTDGEAKMFKVDSAEEWVKLLTFVTSRKDICICPGQWHGSDTESKFRIVSEKKLADMVGSQVGKVDGGVLDVEGNKVAARLKRGINQSDWLLLDADNPPGMPDEWAAMNIQQRLELWEPMLPGVSKCERIELRSSSSRVINGSGSQQKSHAWIRVSDPEKIALMKAYIGVEMVLRGLSFAFEKKSRLDRTKTVGVESRSVFDLAVMDTGRLVFCSEPQLGDGMDGYSVDDAGIEIVNEGAGVLDIDFISVPKPAAIRKYKQKTGVEIKISKATHGISVDSIGQLTLDTEIESRGVVKPLREWAGEMAIGEKLRCEAPFRESISEAAFIRIQDDGHPIVHDVGNGTTYRLQPPTTKSVTLPPKKAKPTVDQVIPSLPVNREGRIVANYESMVSVVECFDIGYDCFLESPMILRNGAWDRFDDADYVDIAIRLEQIGFASLPMAKIKDVVRKVMFSNKFDSAIDWINGLTWDGTDRCSHLFANYFGAAQSDYEGAVSMYFVTAMAARLLQPGAQCDMVPILLGKQGAGKTSGVKALAPIVDSFTEIDLSSRRDNDLARQLRGKLIGELGELRGLKSREAEWIKAWITRTHEEWTPKFVEMARIMPRRCVFVGTTNEDEFLVDQTGNRRWLPIKVNECDIEAIKSDCEQIWAQAAFLFRIAGVRWEDANRLAECVRDEHLIYDDVMVDGVREVLKLARFIGTTDVKLMDVARELFADRMPSRADQHRVADSLRTLGYERTHTMNGKVFRKK